MRRGCAVSPHGFDIKIRSIAPASGDLLKKTTIWAIFHFTTEIYFSIAKVVLVRFSRSGILFTIVT